jgi:hypothetical protein
LFQDDLLSDENGDSIPSSSVEIKLRVPRTSDGWVYVCDTRGVTLAKFPIYRIIFFARGNATSSEAACFAFTCAVVGADKVSSSISFETILSFVALNPFSFIYFNFTIKICYNFQDIQSPTTGRASYECHVFRCQVPEAVTKVFVSFAQVKIITFN